MGGMRIIIAGGHGQIARLLERRLADQGHQPVGIVRNPDHASDLADAGAEALVLDLEKSGVDQVAEALRGADAVVFAAGGGPDSGPERKLTIDRDGAILLADAAERAGVTRYVMISAMAVDGFDPDSDDTYEIYQRAKSEADADLRARDIDWTIVRPGGLTDDAGTAGSRWARPRAAAPSRAPTSPRSWRPRSSTARASASSSRRSRARSPSRRPSRGCATSGTRTARDARGPGWRPPPPRRGPSSASGLLRHPGRAAGDSSGRRHPKPSCSRASHAWCAGAHRPEHPHARTCRRR
ncbi:hypothetical protein MAFF212519_20000 [Clavibacter michiganensis]